MCPQQQQQLSPPYSAVLGANGQTERRQHVHTYTQRLGSFARKRRPEPAEPDDAAHAFRTAKFVKQRRVVYTVNRISWLERGHQGPSTDRSYATSLHTDRRQDFLPGVYRLASAGVLFPVRKANRLRSLFPRRSQACR